MALRDGTQSGRQRYRYHRAIMVRSISLSDTTEVYCLHFQDQVLTRTHTSLYTLVSPFLD